MHGNGSRNRRRKRRRLRKSFIVFVLICAFIFIGIILLISMLFRSACGGDPGNNGSSTEQPADNDENPEDPENPDVTDDPVEQRPVIRIPIPDPYAVEGTRPVEDFGLQTAMELNGNPISEYSRSNPINFGDSNEYTDVEGIVTFRGNNFRDTAAYGSLGASINGNLNIVWETRLPEVTNLTNPDRTWFGLGWTGQPLIIKWSAEDKANMNIVDEKRNNPDLKEVIFGTMGSMIYFLDLDDGLPTRPKVQERWILKGSGALDPRGYPLFYVGSGDTSSAGSGKNLIYGLLDTKELFSYGENTSFADRSWQAFDGSTIVHAPTDSVTYPAENNVIYQFTLNSRYDPHTGTMTIEPSDMLKWKGSTARLREVYGGARGVIDNFQPQYGFESSAAFWREYMYIASNSGLLYCINVNTFEVIWICDTYDDTDATPVLELDHENGRAYIYVGNSAYFTRNRNTNIAQTSFFKIDAVTGEKIWTSEGYRCLMMGTSGGIKATAALGKNDLSDLVFVPFANVANDNGVSMGSYLVAFDKASGEEVWRENFGGQCWSSPVDVYDDSGKGYIIFGTGAYTNRDGERVGGFVHLVDGRTGERLASVETPGQIEASPVVYDNMIVVGTRGQVIYGIRIS